MIMTNGKSKIEVRIIEEYENIKIVAEDTLYFVTINDEMSFMGGHGDCKMLFEFGKKLINAIKR